MLHRLLFSLVLVGYGITPVSGAVPEPPFLAALPPNTAWKAVAAPKTPRPAPTTPAEVQAEKEWNLYRPQLALVEGYKGEADLSFVFTWADGRKTEGFVINGVSFLASNPNYPTDIIVQDPRQGADAPDYSRTDFPKLRWISAATYVEAATEAGRPARLYQLKASGEQGEGRVLEQAWIDAETRLPLRYDDGVNIYTYTFTPASPRQIVPPPSFEGLVSSYRNPANGGK